MKSLLISVSVLLALSGSVLAQSSGSSGSSSGNSNSSSSSASTNTGSIREQLKSNLQKSGYQDISVMPASFVVHAKDKNGVPTAMVVTPDDLTIFKELPSNNNDTNGSSSTKSNHQQ